MTTTLKKGTFAVVMAAFLLVSAQAQSQYKKYDDGTIVYNDGTKRLPNGEVVYKGKSYKKHGEKIVLPDGSIIYGDGDRKYSKKVRYGKKLPPGQAKKIYGGQAKDYAPGQQKIKKNKPNTPTPFPRKKVYKKKKDE